MTTFCDADAVKATSSGQNDNKCLFTIRLTSLTSQILVSLIRTDLDLILHLNSDRISTDHRLNLGR
jgi:hypothetical protein